MNPYLLTVGSVSVIMSVFIILAGLDTDKPVIQAIGIFLLVAGFLTAVAGAL